MNASFRAGVLFLEWSGVNLWRDDKEFVGVLPLSLLAVDAVAESEFEQLGKAVLPFYFIAHIVGHDPVGARS